MPFNRLLRLCLLLCLVWPVVGHGQEINAIHVPLTFEENRGQVDTHARYVAHAERGTILLSENGIAIMGEANGRSIRMHLLRGAKTSPIGEAPTGGVANYYTSKDRKKWSSHIPMFSRVRYAGVYPGVDAVFRGRGDQLEYDFEVAPGSSPNGIAFAFEGSERIAAAVDGGLDIVSGDATLHLMPAVAYQTRGGLRESISVRYVVSRGKSVSFNVDKFDPSTELVIDPVVAYASQLPGNDMTSASAIQIDASGNPIIAGLSGTQATVMKLNAAGDTILYASHIGTATNANSPSLATALALDGSGDAYVAGITSAPDFPTTSTIGSCSGACNGGFVAKFSANCSLVYSVLLGAGQELARSIAVDASGSAYVSGNSPDNLLPTVNAFQTAQADAFFAKLNPSGTGYVFASYFSGPAAGGDIQGEAIALDSSGNIFIAGNTNMDPPLVNSWQSAVGGLFLAKFAPDGKTLLFSTRFGSSQNLSEITPAGDAITGMVIGNDGTIYLAGTTESQDFPFGLNSPAHQVLPSGYEGDFEMFATAIDPSLTKLTYSTYLGIGFLNAMFVDSTGHLYLAGTARAMDLLPLKNSVDSDVSGGFFLELDGSGMPVNVSQFGGHFVSETPGSIAADPLGNVYVAVGGNGSGVAGPQQNFPIANYPPPVDSITVGTPLPGGSGAFFARISPANSPEISISRLAPFLALRNAGSADLHISSIRFSANGGVVSGNCGGTVAAGTSCIVTVTGPGGAIVAGSVTIISDANPATQTYSIQIPPICGLISCPPVTDQLWLSDTRSDHPPQLQGTRQTIPVTVSNVGVANATINEIYTLGDFSESDTCGAQSAPATLLPGGSCVVQLSTMPSGSGGHSVLAFIYDGTMSQDFEDTFIFLTRTTLSQLVLSASAINFGTQQVNGAVVPRVVTITNTGDTPMPAPAVSIEGDSQFVLTGNTCPTAIVSHQSCAVGVQFNPVNESTQTATLNVAGQSVTLVGQGQITSAIQVSPLEVDFDPTSAGYVRSGTLTLTNPSGAPVGIVSISFSLPDFTETDSCQNQIPANGTCTMQISFSPHQIGQRDGTMTIALASGLPTEVIAVEGLALDPLVVTPQGLIFGSPNPGSSSAPQFLSIGNGRGPSPLNFSISISGDFVITQNLCSSPLPGFTGCGLNIAFQPKNSGPEQGALTISYSGTSLQTVVPLSGGSGPGPNITVPTNVSFGDEALDTTGQQFAMITNHDNANLTISNLAINGDQADFKVGAGQCSTIAPGATCGIQINFTPTALGTLNATLSFSDNASTGSYSITLKGNGVTPYTFQTQAPFAITVPQGGTAMFKITAASGSGFTGIVNLACYAVPLGSTCSLQPASIDFSRSSSTTITATITTTAPVKSSYMLRSIDFIASMLCVPAALLCRRRRATVLVLFLVIIAIGCGAGGGSSTSSGGSSGGSGGGNGGTTITVTPTGSYNMVVLGNSTSGSIENTAAGLQLTVQPAP